MQMWLWAMEQIDWSLMPNLCTFTFSYLYQRLRLACDRSSSGKRYFVYLIKWCQVKLFGDELLEVEDCGLCWTADPLALQTSQLAAVALQADADLSERRTHKHSAEDEHPHPCVKHLRRQEFLQSAPNTEWLQATDVKTSEFFICTF